MAMTFHFRSYGGPAIGLASAMLLASCGDGGSTPAPTPIPTATPTPTPPPTAVTAGLFVNPVPDDTAATKAAAYVGWTATAGATGYVVRYSVDGGAPTSITLGTVTGTLIPALSQGSQLSVTIATLGTGGAVSVDSAAVTVTLSRPANAAEMAAYANAAAYSDSLGGEAVVILRNGMTVYTHYTNGYANTVHALASGTKSFNCALEGFAVQDNYVSLSDKASSVISEWVTDPKKSQITLLDLLSLQSGLTGNPGYSPFNASTLDTYQQAVDDTATYAPGQAFVYDPLSFQVFAEIFQVRSGGTYGGNGQVAGGMDPVTYLQNKLFTPIGITASSYGWDRDVKNHPQMAGGASFRATDWLRYGQMVLQRGTWQSTRLLPSATIDYCIGGYKNQAYLGYGVTWWLNQHNNGTYDPTIDQVPPDGGPQAGSDQIAPSAPADMAVAAGLGKERLYVIPSLGIAVVRLAPIASPNPAWSDNIFMGKLLGTLP